MGAIPGKNMFKLGNPEPLKPGRLAGMPKPVGSDLPAPLPIYDDVYGCPLKGFRNGLGLDPSPPCAAMMCGRFKWRKAISTLIGVIS